MTGQIISHIIGTVIGVVVVLSIELIIKVVDNAYWSTRLEERALRDMAEIEAEEQRREEESRIIPKPEKPADVTVEEHEITFCTDTADEDIHIRIIGLYCKGKFVEEYPTRAEAEAARLQFLYDNGVTDEEDFTL